MTGNEPEHKSWVERWYRVMLLGYPARYRERHGAELLGTLLESHPSRRLPSPRESASLLDAGLLIRFRSRLDKVPARADGLHLGVFLLAFKKIILVGLVAVGAAVKKLFGGGKDKRDGGTVA